MPDQVADEERYQRLYVVERAGRVRRLRRQNQMAEVLSLSPVRKRVNNARMYSEQDARTADVTDTRNEHWQRDQTVVPVDFGSKDLQLLRYRARELEETRFVLYKQSTRTEINTRHGILSIAIRVLVQKRMVQYYFYCPLCGSKVFGSLFPKVHGSKNYGLTQWNEIEKAVQNEVRMKALDHEYLNHGAGKRRG